MYTFSYETRQINYPGPKFGRFSEKPFRRTGFVTQAEYDRMAAQNPPLRLRGIMAVGHEIANRHGELINLKVRQVDFINGMIRLDPTDTKNQQGGSGPISSEMRPILEACCWGKGPEDLVFSHEDGSSIGDFRKRLRRLLKNAGIDRHIIFHDFRRSAITNMVHRGIDRDTARAISGHKTDSVFSRYNIVSEKHVVNAVAMIEHGMQTERRIHEELCANRAQKEKLPKENDAKRSN